VLVEPSQAGLRVLSTVPESDFGRPLAAGDLDGDGADDVVIGQSDSYPAGISKVFVIRGRKERWTSPTLEIDLATIPPDRLLVGPSQNINMPTSLAVGDLNGDSIDDLAMTAPNTSPRGRTLAGTVYVVLGATNFFDGPTTLDLTAPGDASVLTFDGAVEGGDLGGKSIFGGLDAHGLAIGDLNGDTIGDLAVGAHLAAPKGRGQAGQVYVVFGRDSFAGGGNYDLANADIRFDGARQYYETGTTLLIADVTGDNIGELIIGCDIAGEDNFFLSSEGIVYLFRGRTTWPPLFDLLASWDLKIRGITDGVGLGTSLAAADLDRDDVNDLCLGAGDRWYESATSDPIGAMEIHYGNATLGSPPSAIRPTQPDILWMGPQAYSLMGYNAVTGYFIDPDHDALAAAAVFADRSPEDQTNGFIEVLGSRSSWPPNAVLPTQIEATHDFRIVGPTGGRFGFGLAAGDANGDGIDEVIVGAPFLGRGEVHVFQLVVAPTEGTGWFLYD